MQILWRHQLCENSEHVVVTVLKIAKIVYPRLQWEMSRFPNTFLRRCICFQDTWLKNVIPTNMITDSPFYGLRRLICKKIFIYCVGIIILLFQTIFCSTMGWDGIVGYLTSHEAYCLCVGNHSGHYLHSRMRWYEMKGQPNRDSNPVPPSQETNHATNWLTRLAASCRSWQSCSWICTVGAVFFPRVYWECNTEGSGTSFG